MDTRLAGLPSPLGTCVVCPRTPRHARLPAGQQQCARTQRHVSNKHDVCSWCCQRHVLCRGCAGTYRAHSVQNSAVQALGVFEALSSGLHALRYVTCGRAAADGHVQAACTAHALALCSHTYAVCTVDSLYRNSLRINSSKVLCRRSACRLASRSQRTRLACTCHANANCHALGALVQPQCHSRMLESSCVAQCSPSTLNNTSLHMASTCT